MTSNKKHFLCIDGLKGVGAFIIAFIWHYQHFSPSNGGPLKFIFHGSYEFGWSMVDLFFIVSGFCIMIGYGEEIIGHQITFKDYIIKRLIKLYPFFFITTLSVTVFEILFIVVNGDTFVYGNFDFYHFIQNIFLLHGGILGTEFSFNGPSWCIPIFVFCYCMLYFILYFNKEKRYLLVFFIIAIFSLIIIASHIDYPIFNSLVGRGVAGFSIGVLLAHFYIYNICKKNSLLGYFCFLFVLLTYVLLRINPSFFSNNFSLIMLICVGPSIVLCSVLLPWVCFILSNPIFKFLGFISWEIYLIHFPIQCCIKLIDYHFDLKIDYSNVFIWLIYIFITLAFASIYHLVISKKIENKFMKLLQLFIII